MAIGEGSIIWDPADGVSERPFWSAMPQCLYCNWDDDWGEEDPGEGFTTYAAYLECPGFAGRGYVAWLCVDCVDSGRIGWFVGVVRSRYPGVVFVASPGTRHETVVPIDGDRA